jgi:serine/threonine-protein kinase
MIDTLGNFRILELVGSTPLGEVCRARDTSVGRTVTLTVVADRIASDPDERQAFLRAAHAAAALSHPNIVTLYEVGEEGEYVFLVHEFTQGQSLHAVIGGHALNPRRAIDLATQIAEGLADAHAAEFVHGALTAKTVVVTPKGNAKIADFGFARWISGTMTGAVDYQADVSALGSVLFEMLTGRAAEPAASVPSAVNRSLPREIDPIVAKALGKSGGYEGAVTLAAELRAVGAMLDARKQASDVRSAVVVRHQTRSRTRLVVISLLVVGLAALTWWFITSG